MHTEEIRRLVTLEDRHWWYAERRALLRRLVPVAPPGGRALDVGAAGGGNTRVLAALGWRATALEYDETGAALALTRNVPAVRANALALPFADSSLGLVTALDVIEHIDDDRGALAEMRRVLAPGGRLVVMVPADPSLWSAHDVAVGHVRRYVRKDLEEAVSSAGLEVDTLRSWNVLLRPVAAWHRRSSSGSDLDEVNPVVNAALRTVVMAERMLPLGNRRGVSLVLTAHRPAA